MPDVVPTVTVTGTGSARVAPDSAVVRVAAVSRGTAVAQAHAAMSAAASRLVECALRHAEQSRIASSGITVWPTRDHEGRESGFEARHAFTIGCGDLDQAGALLTDLAAEVGDELAIDSVGLEVSDDHAARAAAREAAFHDAREAAAQLARMAGAAGLGPVRTVVEGDDVDGAGPVPRRAMARASGGIEAGETTVTSSVTVVWELSV